MEIFVTFVYLIVLNGISTPTIANKDKSPTIATLILVLSQL